MNKLHSPPLEPAGVIMNADTGTGTHQRGVEGGVLHGDGGVGGGGLVRGGVGGGVHAAAQTRHAPAQPRVAWHIRTSVTHWNKRQSKILGGQKENASKKG